MSKIIRGENLGHVSEWKMPEVNSNSKTIERNTDYYDGIAALGGEIPTAKELEELQKKAYDDSYKEGYQDGLNIAKDEQAKIMLTLTNLLSEFSSLREQIDSDVKKEISELAILVAKQIIRRDISSRPECILSIVEESVNLLPVFSKEITIYLNPDDAAIILETIETAAEKNQWNIVEDSNLSRGGCKVITSSSVLDNTVEMQISKIAAKFLDHLDDGHQEIMI